MQRLNARLGIVLSCSTNMWDYGGRSDERLRRGRSPSLTVVLYIIMFDQKQSTVSLQ